MKKIILNLIFIFVSVVLMGSKKEEYKIINKEIEGRNFYFAIPNSFCEYNMYSSEIFQFVKCYEIELKKAGELPFFSEKILIAFEKDDKRVQNMTDKLFAEIQEYNYNKMSDEQKNQYYYSESYPLNSKQKTKIVNNNHIFNRTAYDENGNKFTIYESHIFLNKRYFIMDWFQYLTKNEKLISEKKFTNFIEKNVELNEHNDVIYTYKGKQILLSKPKFDKFINYTDIKFINKVGFDGFFMNLIKNKSKNNSLKVFKISMLSSNLSTKEVFEAHKKEMDGTIFSNIELVKYRGIDFIKTIKNNDAIMYLCYINFSDNITALLSMDIDKVDGYEKNRDINYIYRYREQLIKDNL